MVDYPMSLIRYFSDICDSKNDLYILSILVEV